MATTSEKLTEAENALHDWSVGRGVIEVRDASGDVLRYSAANVVKPRAYIAELKGLLGQTGSPVTRPMGLWW